MRFGGEFTYIQLNVAYGAYTQAVEVLGSDLSPSALIAWSMPAALPTRPGSLPVPSLQFTGRVNREGALPCASDPYGNPIVTAACTVAPPLPAASPARSYRYKDWALYAQDSFKLTRRLTINYGLRYEHYGVQHNDIQSLDSNFYPVLVGQAWLVPRITSGTAKSCSLPRVPSVNSGSPGGVPSAPRVGFAYDVFGDGKTALRGGFGISYERNFGNVTYNASFNPPASAAITELCNANRRACHHLPVTLSPTMISDPWALPGPATALSPVELRDNDANVNVAQTQFWSLDLQHQLAPNTILTSPTAERIRSISMTSLTSICSAPRQAYLGDPLLTGTGADGTETCPYSNPVTGTPTCYTRPTRSMRTSTAEAAMALAAITPLTLNSRRRICTTPV